MTKPKTRSNIKNKATPQKFTQRAANLKEKVITENKVVVTTGDKNAQVLAATVGGAVIGNLIAPGIGGALFGGVIGAWLGNSSSNKGGK